MTRGEYRVGVTFNPSNDDQVARIKRAAADLIDMLDAIDFHSDNPMWDGERARLRALAQKAIEEGAMWAVKAATKPEFK